MYMILNKVLFYNTQIFDVFDVKRNGVIEFGEFVRSLGVFHPNAPVHEKIKCHSSNPKNCFTFILCEVLNILFLLS